MVATPSYRQEESFTLLDSGYNEDPFCKWRRSNSPASDDSLLCYQVEKHPRRQPRKVSLAIVAGLITFFFLDFVAYLYIARMLLSHRPLEDELEFRNPYIGLNELYSSKEARPSKYDRIVNVPRLAAHVSWVEPELVMPFDVHRWLTDFG